MYNGLDVILVYIDSVLWLAEHNYYVTSDRCTFPLHTRYLRDRLYNNYYGAHGVFYLYLITAMAFIIVCIQSTTRYKY